MSFLGKANIFVPEAPLMRRLKIVFDLLKKITKIKPMLFLLKILPILKVSSL
jgi:hypothetical protein